VRALGGSGRTLAFMGVLDAFAIGLVTASASLPNPEYAAISSSLFGVLTILLAWRILKERVAPLQWLGIATVFTGIAVLSAQG
jgi:drug/metabolite transporter (DMT)-like permease